MSYTLCRKVRNLTPYEPIKGSYRIRLDANESCFSLPDELREQLGRLAAEMDYNRYPDPLADRLCTAFGAAYGLSPELVTAGDGSDELISIITGCLLEKGDPILTFSPDFSMYHFYGELAEHPVLVMEKDEDFGVDVDAVIRTIREQQVKMLIFSNPCNPASVGLPRAEVRRLIRSTDALVVLDEAYMDFWDQSLLGEAENYDNLIILKTCSKAVGMAGIRVGFAVAGKPLTRALRAVKSPYNVNSFSQEAAALILEQRDYLEDCRSQLIASRQALQQGCEALAKAHPALFEKLWPSVTNFVLIRSGRAKEIWQALLARSIAVRCFDGFLRITAGLPEENAAVLAALEEILTEMEDKA